MALPTVEEALEHLGYDSTDPVIVRNVTRDLSAAVALLRGSVGDDVEDLMPDDARAADLVLVYLEDLWDERGLSAKASGAARRLVHDMEWQLRLELQRLRDAATKGATV